LYVLGGPVCDNSDQEVMDLGIAIGIALGAVNQKRMRNGDSGIIPEVSRLDRRLNGRVKIYFAASSTILDLPVPELWTMGTKLSYM